jgi:hypothetical protein
VRRFISQDPLDFSGGDTNLYAYAWGDPVNYVDPVGLGGWSIGGIKDGLSHFARSALNFDVAFSNEITGGGVMATLMLTGGIDQVDVCSDAFRQGGRSGLVVGFLIPGGGEAKFGFKVTKSWKEITARLEKHHGIDPLLAKARLHVIKPGAGRGGEDNVVFDLTGNIYNPKTGELLGSLTQGGAKAIK